MSSPGNPRLNLFLGSLFFAPRGGFPLAFSRHRHFLHHRHYSTDLDTKTSYRRDIRGMRLWLEVLKKLTMIEYFSHVFAVLSYMRKESKAPATSGPGVIAVLPPVIVAQAAIFAAFYPIHPLAYFSLWLAPLLTLQMLFLSLRAITEHQPPRALGGDSNSPYFLDTHDAFVRTVGANLFDRLFLCKINFG